MPAFVDEAYIRFGPAAKGYGYPFHGAVRIRWIADSEVVMERLVVQDRFTAQDWRDLEREMAELGVRAYRIERRCKDGKIRWTRHLWKSHRYVKDDSPWEK